MNSSRAALAAILIAFASLAAAQQFKWTDKNGKTQYGDNPPPGVKATPLKAPAGPAAQPAAPASKDGKDAAKDAKKGPLTPAEQEQAFRQRQLEAKKAQEKAEAEQKDAAAKADNCNRAREQLRTLESGARITRTDAKGETFFLDDSQRAAEIQKSRKSVSDWCGA